jgi:hypothetical protein
MTMESDAVIEGSATLVAFNCKTIVSSEGRVTVGFTMFAFEKITPDGPLRTVHWTVTAPPPGSDALPASDVVKTPLASD